MSSPTVIVNSTPVVKVSYGLPGIGVPSGGVKPQVLKKSSSTDYDTEWGDVEVLMLDRTDLTFSGTLSKGDPVYVNSSGQIAACDASDSATLPPVGLVAGDVSASGDDVDVILIGAILETNTSSFSVGDRLYVAVGGGLTSTAPSGLNGSFSVGFVSKSNATEGIISVNIDVSNGTFEGLAEDNIWIGNASGVATQYEHQLKRLTDVDSALAPSANQLLRYSGTQWEAVSLGFDDIPLTQLSEGHVYVGDSSNETTTTDTIYVDIANSRVGIGTTSPQEALDIAGRLGIVDGTDTIHIGPSAGGDITSGSNGVFIGALAGEKLTAANSQTYIGHKAGRWAQGSLNTAVGYESLQGSSNTVSTSSFNTSVGAGSLKLNESGFSNSSFGFSALSGNVSGHSNVAIGAIAASNASAASFTTSIGANSNVYSSGSNNTMIGYGAGLGIILQSTFENTVAVGYEALKALKTGASNTAIGYEALHDLTTGSRNTVLGYQAGDSLTTQNENTLIGYQTSGAVSAVAVGTQAQGSGNGSISIGSISQSNANNTISIGTSAISENVGSVAIGYLSRAHETGVFVGYQTGRYNNGEGNTVIGYEAGQGQNTQNGSGYDDNVLVGYRAGFNLEGGSGNVFIGYGAGHTLENDNHRLHITGRVAYPTSTPLIYGEFDNELVRINGDLDVKSEIISTGGDNIVLNPGGLANVEIGNYVFDGDQTVDQTTDNYVLTYDDATGLISLTENIIEVEGATTVVTAVRNDTGTAIPAGTALYSLGETAGTSRILVGVADASDSSKMPAIGIAATDLGTTGADRDGDAIILGDFDTAMSGYTGLDNNDILYVAGSGGGFPTNVKPTGTDLIQNIGVVLKANGTGTQCQALKVSCIGRTNDVPNIQQNYAWIGNASGVATPTELETTVLTDVDSNASYTSGEVLIWHNTQGQFVSNNITGSGDITVTNGDGTIEIGTSFTDTHIGNTDLTLTADRELALDGKLLEIKHGTLTYLNVDANTSAIDMKAADVSITGETDVYGLVHFRGEVASAHGAVAFHEAANQQAGFDRSITFQAPNNLTANSTYTLPSDEPSADGYVLTSSAAGVMSWAAPATDNTVDVNISDVVSLDAQEINAVDAGSDKIVFWDDSESKLTYLTVGSGLTLTGTEITADAQSDTNIANTNLTLDANRTLDLKDAAGSYELDIVEDTTSLFKITSANGAYGNNKIDIGVSRLTIDSETFIENTLNVKGSAASLPGEIRLNEALDNGSFYTGFKAPDLLTASSAYTMPTYYPDTTGKVLSSTNAGVLSWIAQSSGDNLGNSNLTQTASQDRTYTTASSQTLEIKTTQGLGIKWDDIDDPGSTNLDNLVVTANEGRLVVRALANDQVGSIRFLESANAGNTPSRHITLKVPDSITANVTLTLPNGSGDSGQVLQTNGSGVLSWVDQTAIPTLNITRVSGTGGLSEVPFYSNNNLILDSSDTFTFSGGTLSTPKIASDQIPQVRPTGSTASIGDFGANSETMSKIGSNVSVVAGRVYNLAGGFFSLTDAEAEADSKGLLAVASGTGTTNGTEMVLKGSVKMSTNAAFSSASIGDPVYLRGTDGSQANKGTLTATPPSSNGDIVRVVGYVMDPSNGVVYFNPDNSYIEV